MSSSIVSPRQRLDLLLSLTFEYLVCLIAASIVWHDIELVGAALFFAGLYAIRGLNWLLRSGSSMLSFWLTREQRVDTLVATMRRLGMPEYGDSYRYDDAPNLIAGIAQRADLNESLREFLMALVGEFQFMRSNRLGIAYVQGLSVLNAALSKYQKDMPNSGRLPFEERRTGRGLQAA
jgi:hypothetical protein